MIDDEPYKAPEPIEAAALFAFHRLTGPSVTTSLDGFSKFRPGDDTSDTICHVQTFSNTLFEDEVEAIEDDTWRDFASGISRGSIDIYLGRDGTQLLRLAREIERRYAQRGERFEFRMTLIIELPGDAERGIAEDVFPGQVFEVIASHPDGLSTAEVLKTFLPAMPHILMHLPALVGLSRRAFEARMTRRADQGSGVFDPLIERAAKEAGTFVGLIAVQVAHLAHYLDQNSRMPPELWNPGKRPQSFTELLDTLDKGLPLKLDEIASRIKDTDFGLEAAANLTSSIPVLNEIIDFMLATWRSVQTVMTSIVDAIKGTLDDARESLETIIGYVSGLWDGVMEAVIGFLELGAILLQVIGAFLMASHDPTRIRAVLREFTDEIVQALIRVDWVRFWTRFATEILPLIVDLLKKKGKVFIDEATRHSAVAGYYFGYLVYTIIEFFIPPLKFSKIAQEARVLRAALSGRFFAKVMA